MNINIFLDKENITTLWDVISDEEIFKFLARDIQIGIANLFSNNIKGFFETERTKTNNLVELNKKYILLILNYIKKVHPYQPNKIKIYDELPSKVSITAEEIQTERKTQFDIDLQNRQQEFENSINMKKPPVPEFTDKYEDTPILGMDKIIKEITEKRNYDVEQINRNYNSDINVTNEWLKTQGTSLKNDKLTNQPNQPSQINQTHNSRFKFLNNMQEDTHFEDTHLKETPIKKNITWAENEEFENDTEEQNIFSKLKKVSVKPYIKDKEKDKEKDKDKEEKNEERLNKLENQIKILTDNINMLLKYNTLNK